MKIGTMVRSGASEPMKVIGLSGDIAECVQIDSNGIIRRRFHREAHLTLMVDTLKPRSFWPEITHRDQIQNEREERQALAEKEAARKAAKKSKRSNKIKRAGPEAA